MLVNLTEENFSRGNTIDTTNGSSFDTTLTALHLPLYDVHWDAAVVLDKGGGKRGDGLIKVGLANGRVLPLTGASTSSTCRAAAASASRVIADGSTAQSVGFQKGDIVVTVNNQKIERSADLERVTRAGGRTWRITVNRGGQQISVMLSG